MEKYFEILQRLALLLDRNGHSFQRGFIDRLLARLQNGEGLSVLTSNDIWGGSGSVTDCNLLSSTVQSRDLAEKDQREFLVLITHLARRLSDDGIATARVLSVGATYDRWSVLRQKRFWEFWRKS